MIVRKPLFFSPRALALLALALCAPITALLYLTGSTPTSFLVGADRLASTRGHDALPVADVEGYMQAYLDELAAARDPSDDEELYGLKLGDASLSAYTDFLLDTYATYLAADGPGVPEPAYMSLVRARLALRPPAAPWPPRPRQLLTTERDPGNMPHAWRRWSKLMPDWARRVFDDAELAAWVARAFGGARARAVWDALPRVVLKTDVFRYMILLVEGGIYTDSDTAPIIEAEQWGVPYEAGTPPLLTHLSRVLSLASEGPGEDGDGHRGTLAWHDALVEDGGELGEPGLVVSIETDAVMFGWDNWREVGLARKVQMTQWTISARPGHPVLLDALGRTLRKSEDVARAQAAADDAGEPFVPETALEWTGPGVFTDCVYRYLLARYGVTPEDVFYVRSPVRIGDVLILPSGSFSAVSPWTPKIQQREWAAVHHAFLGRWRTEDPGIAALERVKEDDGAAGAAAAEVAEEAERAASRAGAGEGEAGEAEAGEAEAGEAGASGADAGRPEGNVEFPWGDKKLSAVD